MPGTIRRYIVASIYYGIGLVLAYFATFAILLQALLKGRKGIVGLYKRGKHDKEPEIARKDFNHDYVRTNSGVRFHYVHAGDEDNPLMLCLHGFPECWYSWKYILKKFSTDYHVVAIDMRGYGASDKPNSISMYHLTYLVNDVREIIEALGYQQAVLVGHDWGGIVVWHVPLYFPDYVSKIIVMNSPNATGMRGFLQKNPSQIMKSWYMFFFQIPFLPEFLIGFDDYQQINDHYQGKLGKIGLQNPSNYLSDDEVEIYKNAAMRNIRYGINYYRATNPIYQGLEIKPVTRQIVQPTLVIWGKEDVALDVNMVPFCLKGVTNSKSVIIKEASHCVGLDEPEKVSDAIEEFLQEYKDEDM